MHIDVGNCQTRFITVVSRVGNTTCQWIQFLENVVSACLKREVTIHTQIISTKRKRKRIRFHPPRNNGHLNQCIKSPLVALGHGGNHDCQRIANLTGAAEYIASYNSKQDDPDFRAVDNLYANKIANLRLWKATIEERDHLRAAATAVCSSQHISTVQAVYTLLNLPFVQSSRKVSNIKCLRRQEMTFYCF